MLSGLDFGYTGASDPSIIVMCAFDPDTGKKYLFAEWSSEMDREQYANSHMPDYMACKLIGRAPKDWQENSGTDEEEFAALGYVQRIDGKRGNYVYALIKSPALDAVLEKPDEPEQPQGLSIFDQCRANWKGYEFHQIIGSTSRRLTA